MNRDLELALELADAADEITLRWFRAKSLEVRTKTDRTPVSFSDEETERMIRERLGRERPGDGIIGEEFGVTGESSRRWIIDPIDATKNYVRGIPVFATLIALEEDGRIVAGVVSAPGINKRWWASRGEGAFSNGEAIHVSTVGSLGDAYLSSYALSEPFLTLARASRRPMAFSDFWSHMLVAEGALDVAVEPVLALWDMAPLQIIVEEAGGRFTDLQGHARHDGANGLSTNGLLHDQVLEYFR